MQVTYVWSWDQEGLCLDRWGRKEKLTGVDVEYRSG